MGKLMKTRSYKYIMNFLRRINQLKIFFECRIRLSYPYRSGELIKDVNLIRRVYKDSQIGTRTVQSLGIEYFPLVNQDKQDNSQSGGGLLNGT